MRLLVADKLMREPLEELEVLGIEIVHSPGLTPETLPDALKDVGILVVRSTKVTAAAFEKAPHLSLVVRAGAGVNTIDVNAASRHGVYVANCPGKNAAAVAELTMGLILALDRRLVDATQSLREGRWEKSEYSKAEGLLGRRLGIAGFGSIGQRVARAAQALGMQVHAWSRSLSPAKAAAKKVGHAASLVELAGKSEILSVHLPLTDSTDKVVDREVLEALPDGAMVINTARAEVMDYAALAELAPAKQLRLGLDVFEEEPKGVDGFSSPLLSCGAVVYGAPHIGASTEEAQRAIAREVVNIVRAYMTEEDVPNVVNVCSTTPARFALVLRARDEVGVLANVLGVIKRHGLNIEEMNNTVFEGARAACTKLRLTGRPSDSCIQEILAFEEVFHADVVTLPNLA